MANSEWQNQIGSVLSTFGRVSGQGAVFHEQAGTRPRKNANTCGFCRYALEHPVTGDFCRYACHSAAMQTLSSGEPHYQRCWAGLLYVSVAVAHRGTYRGGISCGGFYAEEEASEIEEQVAARLGSVPNVEPEPFLARIRSLRAISPGALRGLGQLLLESTFSGGVNASAYFQKLHERYERQRRIADAYASIRDHAMEPPDLMGDVYRLVSFLRRGEREGAMQGISDYLARLLLVSQWNLTRLRAHVRVLVAVITSQDVLDGMDWTAATRRELMTMARIEKSEDVEAICSEVAELVLAHFGKSESGVEQAPLSDKVMAWLQGHFHERATVQDAAIAVGASVSSIAHRLPQEVGKTYRQLRRELRVAEAKRLLATTDIGISEIADQCGFTDQSHFTRVFREEISLTPGQFRAMLPARK